MMKFPTRLRHWLAKVPAMLALTVAVACTPLDEKAPMAPVELPPTQPQLAPGGTLAPVVEIRPQSPSSALPSAEYYPAEVRYTEPQSSGGVSTSSQGGVTLNFVGADVREVVDTILGEILGRSYSVDPAVQGEVTVRTVQPIARERLFPLLETVLATNGAVVVQTQGMLQVMMADAATPGLASVVEPGAPLPVERGFGLYFFPLQYAAAGKIEEVLRPAAPPGRTLIADTSRNLIVFVGTGAEAANLLELISVFDVDWLSGMSYALFPVRFAAPEILAGELEQVFAPSLDASGGLLTFVPLDRLDAVLAISTVPAHLQEVGAWVKRLDRGSDSDAVGVYVYRVQNSRASVLADVLSEVFGVAATEAGAEVAAPGLETIEFGSSFQEEGEESAFETVYEEDEGAFAYDDAAPADDRSLRIVADVTNNALIIRGTAEQYRMVLGALEQLDIEPLQVLIEATIAEVTLNDDLKYGVQWFFEGGDSTVSFSSAATGAVASAFPGFSYVLDTGDIRLVLNALSSVTDVRVVSSPQLMVLNNQVARLQVGDQVPVAVQSAVSVTDPDAPIVNAIEFRDTGVILEVAPRVNAGGLVVLDIAQEVSDVVETTSSTLNSPTIRQRRIQTSVAIGSGGTIALGGLIRQSQTDGETGLPLLSDIPIVGNLFKTTSDLNQRTELIVLLTPRVVQGAEQSRSVTEELKARMRTITFINATGN